MERGVYLNGEMKILVYFISHPIKKVYYKKPSDRAKWSRTTYEMSLDELLHHWTLAD